MREKVILGHRDVNYSSNIELLHGKMHMLVIC